MRDLRLFATESCPLHPSSMRMLMVCPWQAVMRYLYQPEEESGEAADTGSAVHAAVAAMHSGAGVAESLEVMKQRLHRYSRADLQDAATLFLCYSLDDRNRGAAVLCTEEPIAFSIAPAAHDPTGAPISVIGTMDQVREYRGELYLYDIKTSKKDAIELLNAHAVQQAAYCVGASVKLGRTVNPGGLILPRKYREPYSSAPVFWKYPWTLADTGYILEGVRHVVANIRRGEVYHVANNACCWCPARTPDRCLPALKEYSKSLKELPLCTSRSTSG